MLRIHASRDSRGFSLIIDKQYNIRPNIHRALPLPQFQCQRLLRGFEAGPRDFSFSLGQWPLGGTTTADGRAWGHAFGPGGRGRGLWVLAML